jgi:microcystin-dependent protein
LFAALGTRYGSGDGSTTFNVPDFKGRIPVGYDLSQTEFDNLGEKGGAKTVTLTTDQLPAHTHGILGYSGKDDQNFTGNVSRLNASDAFVEYDQPTGSTGGGTSHNNLQPYITVSYIVATGKSGEIQSEPGGIPKPRNFTSKDRGTTAQRDAKYGSPSTDAARVALANQKVSWYNTDLGWTESYYAVHQTTGLTALGLVSGATAGWYPVTEGPYVIVESTQTTTVMVNSIIGGWSMLRRKGGASWFTLTGGQRINVLKHGRYDIKAWTVQQDGANTVDYVLQVFASDGTTFLNGVSGGAFNRMTGLLTRVHQECDDLIIAPDSQVAFRMQQGTIAETTNDVHAGIYMPRGRMMVKYLGPPLVTD